jgi:hypothetical protein
VAPLEMSSTQGDNGVVRGLSKGHVERCIANYMMSCHPTCCCHRDAGDCSSFEQGDGRDGFSMREGQAYCCPAVPMVNSLRRRTGERERVAAPVHYGRSREHWTPATPRRPQLYGLPLTG